MTDSTGYWAASHYTFYWKLTPSQRQTLTSRQPLMYAASNQLQRVQPGDVLWMVNVYLGNLYLVGKLLVEFVVDNTELALELVDPQTDEWYEADWYAIANRYNAEAMREVDITPLAGGLRFDSEAYQLDLDNGVQATQLTQLRKLTSESAQILEQVWYDDEYTPEDIQDYLELSEDDKAYNEGKLIVRTLRERQRNRNLVEDAKARFKALHGSLYCEGCGFNFEDTYGVDYIEAHHIEQMASYDGERETSIGDLVMLCSNCHRMVHTRTPPLTLAELQRLIRKKAGNGQQLEGNEHGHTTRD